MNKKILFAFLCALAALLAGGFILARNNSAISPGSGTGSAATSSSAEGRYMDIETYVKTSIAALSPVHETLGGTFYVTHIETHGGAGTVQYEDGHNAYTADFMYAVDEKGKPSVTSFTVRN